MAYRITALSTRKASPHSPQRRHQLARRTIMIGQRKMHGGERISISDAVYDRFKKVIDQYAALGLIELKPIANSASVVNEIPTEFTPLETVDDAAQPATELLVPELPETTASGAVEVSLPPLAVEDLPPAVSTIPELPPVKKRAPRTSKLADMPGAPEAVAPAETAPAVAETPSAEEVLPAEEAPAPSAPVEDALTVPPVPKRRARKTEN